MCEAGCAGGKGERGSGWGISVLGGCGQCVMRVDDKRVGVCEADQVGGDPLHVTTIIINNQFLLFLCLHCHLLPLHPNNPSTPLPHHALNLPLQPAHHLSHSHQILLVVLPLQLFLDLHLVQGLLVGGELVEAVLEFLAEELVLVGEVEVLWGEGLVGLLKLL